MKPKSILIVLLGALGDVVRGLSVADAIKAWSKDTKIDWLVEPKSKGVVELSPSVDNVIVYNRNTPISGLFNLRAQLNKNIAEFGPYDICLDMQRHFKSGFFSWLSRAAMRVGFHPSNTKELNHFFQTHTISQVSDLDNKFYHYQEFAKFIGCTIQSNTNTKLQIKIENPLLQSGFKAKNYTFVVLGSSWNSKNWFFDGYDSVIKSLLSQNESVVLVGTQDQQLLSNQILTANPKFAESKLISMVGKTNLSQLCAIINEARVGVGPDSGPGHISAAFGVPYVSLFGPTSPERVAPIGMRGVISVTAQD
jgi:ADP-heptose:LPS heptosyltransferase